MKRLSFIAGSVAVAAAAVLVFTPPAQAQIGTIFSDPPLRPPGNVPRGNGPEPDEEEEVPDLPRQGRVLPAPTQRVAPGQPVPPPGAVQSEPLPPAAGGVARPPGVPQPPGVAATPNNVPPGQKQPPRNAPPVPATVQPGDEIVTEPPMQKIVNKQATFSGLDKITGRITSFDADMGETVQFGALRIKPQACYTRPATEAANTDAFVEVDEITLQGEVKRIFSGWMFAASPGLHGIEHPIYDVWLTDCKGPAQTVSLAPEPKPAPPQAPQQTKQRPQRQQVQQQRPPAQLPPPQMQAPQPQPEPRAEQPAQQPSIFNIFR